MPKRIASPKDVKSMICTAEPVKCTSESNEAKTARFKKLHRRIEKLLYKNAAAFIALPNKETGIVELRLLDIEDAMEFERRLSGSIQEQLMDSINSQGDVISAPENQDKQDGKSQETSSQEGYEESRQEEEKIS